jgi:single-stranded-DNA-specific exonuclease
MKGMIIEDIIPVGMNRHLKLILSKNGMSFTAMRFCTAIEDLGYEVGDEIDIAFNLEINEFMNVKTVQFNIKDIKTSETVINEQEKGEREYELARAGEYEGSSADIIPCREDFAFMYNFLLHEAREGIGEYSYVRLLHAIRAKKREFSIGYIKLKLMIKVFRELNIVSITEKDETSFEFRISYTKTKTSLDKSNILKRMRTLYQSK